MPYLNYYVTPIPGNTVKQNMRNWENSRGIIKTKHLDNDYRNPANIKNIRQKTTVANNNVTRALRAYFNARGVSVPSLSILSLAQANKGMLYSTFRIHKQNGGFRILEAPIAFLKEYQRTMLNIIIDNSKYLAHNAAHGCVKHRNCKTALMQHQRNNSKWFLKLDLKNAFGSVNTGLLYDAVKDSAIIFNCFHGRTSDLNAFINLTTNGDGALPQGAPTSPLLLNVYLQLLDEAISTYCKERKLIYTRYVDDLLISGYEKFNHVDLITFIRLNLPIGMRINNEKTRYGSINWKNWNLGIMLNKDNDLTVGYRTKHTFKCAVHNYNSKPELQTAGNYMQLNGLLSYYKSVEPEYFKEKFVLTKPTVITVPTEVILPTVSTPIAIEEAITLIPADVLATNDTAPAWLTHGDDDDIEEDDEEDDTAFPPF